MKNPQNRHTELRSVFKVILFFVRIPSCFGVIGQTSRIEIVPLLGPALEIRLLGRTDLLGARQDLRSIGCGNFIRRRKRRLRGRTGITGVHRPGTPSTSRTAKEIPDGSICTSCQSQSRQNHYNCKYSFHGTDPR